MPNPWVSKAAMPAARSRFGVAQIGTAIFVVGGSTGGDTAAEVYKYEQSTGVWTTLAPLPVALDDVAVAAVGTKLYCAGGQTTLGVTVATLYEYDPALNTWTAKAALPAAREHAMAEGIGTKLYVVGGRAGVSPWAVQSTCYEYDPATNTWTTKAPIPVDGADDGTRAQAAHTVKDGLLYIIGGWDELNGESQSTVKIFNPVTNGWTTGPPMPEARQTGAAAMASGTHIFVAGGSGISGAGPLTGTKSTLFSLNVAAGTWETWGLPYPVQQHGAAVVGELLYVFGGFDGGFNILDFTREWDFVEALAAPAEIDATLNRGQIRTLAKRRFSDVGGAVYSDADWNAWIQEGYEDMRSSSPYWPAVDDTETLTVPTTGFATLPAGVSKVTAVYDLTNENPLSEMGGGRGNRFRNYPAVVSAGTPQEYRVFGQKLEVWPTPETSTQVVIEFRATTASNELSVDDDTPAMFPEQYRRALVHFAVAQAWLQDENPEMAGAYLAKYDSVVTQAKADLLGSRGEGFFEMTDDWY